MCWTPVEIRKGDDRKRCGDPWSENEGSGGVGGQIVKLAADRPGCRPSVGALCAYTHGGAKAY